MNNIWVFFCSLNYGENIFYFLILHVASVKNSTEAAGKETFYTQENCGLQTSGTAFITLNSPVKVSRSSFPSKLHGANESW